MILCQCMSRCDSIPIFTVQYINVFVNTTECKYKLKVFFFELSRLTEVPIEYFSLKNFLIYTIGAYSQSPVHLRVFSINRSRTLESLYGALHCNALH